MVNAKDVYQFSMIIIIHNNIYFRFIYDIRYYVVVCEDRKRNKLAATGTVFIEKKFLRGGGLVRSPSL